MLQTKRVQLDDVNYNSISQLILSHKVTSSWLKIPVSLPYQALGCNNIPTGTKHSLRGATGCTYIEVLFSQSGKARKFFTWHFHHSSGLEWISG